MYNKPPHRNSIGVCAMSRPRNAIALPSLLCLRKNPGLEKKFLPGLLAERDGNGSIPRFRNLDGFGRMLDPPNFCLNLGEDLGPDRPDRLEALIEEFREEHRRTSAKDDE